MRAKRQLCAIACIRLPPLEGHRPEELAGAFLQGTLELPSIESSDGQPIQVSGAVPPCTTPLPNNPDFLAPWINKIVLRSCRYPEVEALGEDPSLVLRRSDDKFLEIMVGIGSKFDHLKGVLREKASQIRGKEAQLVLREAKGSAVHCHVAVAGWIALTDEIHAGQQAAAQRCVRAMSDTTFAALWQARVRGGGVLCRAASRGMFELCAELLARLDRSCLLAVDVKVRALLQGTGQWNVGCCIEPGGWGAATRAHARALLSKLEEERGKGHGTRALMREMSRFLMWDDDPEAALHRAIIHGDRAEAEHLLSIIAIEAWPVQWQCGRASGTLLHDAAARPETVDLVPRLLLAILGDPWLQSDEQRKLLLSRSQDGSMFTQLLAPDRLKAVYDAMRFTLYSIGIEGCASGCFVQAEAQRQSPAGGDWGQAVRSPGTVSKLVVREALGEIGKLLRMAWPDPLAVAAALDRLGAKRLCNLVDSCTAPRVAGPLHRAARRRLEDAVHRMLVGVLSDTKLTPERKYELLSMRDEAGMTFLDLMTPVASQRLLRLQSGFLNSAVVSSERLRDTAVQRHARCSELKRQLEAAMNRPGRGACGSLKLLCTALETASLPAIRWAMRVVVSDPSELFRYLGPLTPEVLRKIGELSASLRKAADPLLQVFSAQRGSGPQTLAEVLRARLRRVKDSREQDALMVLVAAVEREQPGRILEVLEWVVRPDVELATDVKIELLEVTDAQRNGFRALLGQGCHERLDELYGSLLANHQS